MAGTYRAGCCGVVDVSVMFVGVMGVLMAAVGGKGDEEAVELTKSLMYGFMRANQYTEGRGSAGRDRKGRGREGTGTTGWEEDVKVEWERVSIRGEAG